MFDQSLRLTKVRIVPAVIFATSLVIALQGCSEDPKPVKSVKIDDATSCAFAEKAFDQNDSESIFALATYIKKTMQEEETRRRGNLIKKMDRDGVSYLAAMPLAYCRQGTVTTLRQAVLQAYEGVAALHNELIER